MFGSFGSSNSSSGAQLGQLNLSSVKEFQFLAAAQPLDTFWRSIDMAIASFETLQVLPSSARPQYRAEAATTFKDVLTSVRKYGLKGLPGDAKKYLEQTLQILDQLKAQAKNDAEFDQALDLLRQVAQERPKTGEGGKNVSNNTGTMYGLNNGDSGAVTFNSLPKA